MRNSRVHADDYEYRTPEEARAIKWLWIAYWLYAGSILFGLCAVAAVIIDYIKSEDIKAWGPVYASHVRWQIRTFWYTLLWAVIAAILSLIYIGVIIGAILAVWYLYRVIKGMVYLSDAKPMY